MVNSIGDLAVGAWYVMCRVLCVVRVAFKFKQGFRLYFVGILMTGSVLTLHFSTISFLSVVLGIGEETTATDGIARGHRSAEVEW